MSENVLRVTCEDLTTGETEIAEYRQSTFPTQRGAK